MIDSAPSFRSSARPSRRFWTVSRSFGRRETCGGDQSGEIPQDFRRVDAQWVLLRKRRALQDALRFGRQSSSLLESIPLAHQRGQVRQGEGELGVIGTEEPSLDDDGAPIELLGLVRTGSGRANAGEIVE